MKRRNDRKALGYGSKSEDDSGTKRRRRRTVKKEERIAISTVDELMKVLDAYHHGMAPAEVGEYVRKYGYEGLGIETGKPKKRRRSKKTAKETGSELER